MPRSTNPTKWIAATLLVLVVSGCAHTNGPEARSDTDPLEPYNRAMFQFNERADQIVIKPLAQGYKRVVPDGMRKSVGNFFLNLSEPTTIVNDILQGKLSQAAHDTMRFIINSTWGVLGLFDVATPMGMARHEEDFGQTFSVWGIGQGPYLVLPLWGPSTLTDGIGLIPAVLYTDPRTAVKLKDEIEYGLIATNVIDTRARFLGASKVADVQLDPYVFRRESYLQRRQQLVYDGNPPLPFDDEFDEALEREAEGS